MLELNEQQSELKRQQEELITQKNEAQKKLDRANTLISSIGSEKDRWIATKAKLGESKLTLLGDTILAAANVTYLGPFDWKFRTKAIHEMWMDSIRQFQVDYSHSYSLKEVVTNTGQRSSKQHEPGVFDEDVTDWLTSGLPNEQVCIDNMIILEESRQSHYPILVDPQGQAIKFLKELFKDGR